MTTKRRSEEYAKAIYELALETWTQQLARVQAALDRSPGLRQVLSDPQAKPADQREWLDRGLEEPLGPQVANFVLLLAQDGQIGQLEGILADLERLVRHGPKVQIAEITSAMPLTPAEEEKLREVLTRRFGSDLEFRFGTDPSLLGGVHVRVGDQVIDGSVAGKLEALRDRLAA